MTGRRAWFAPKSRGYGSSWPIAWQGWAVLVAFFGGMGLSGAYLQGWLRLAAFTALVLAFALVCFRTTEGGWRNRP